MCTMVGYTLEGYIYQYVRQIGPIVDKQPVRRQLDGYEEEEILDRSGPDLYRAMRGYPCMGSGDRCGLLYNEVQLYVTGAEIGNVWKSGKILRR